jgi:hypothetical protein
MIHTLLAPTRVKGGTRRWFSRKFYERLEVKIDIAGVFAYGDSWSRLRFIMNCSAQVIPPPADLLCATAACLSDTALSRVACSVRACSLSGSVRGQTVDIERTPVAAYVSCADDMLR